MKSTTILLAAALVFGGCANDPPPNDPPPVTWNSSPSPTDTVALPKDNTLFFLAGSNLYTANTKSAKTKVVWGVGTEDVSIAPDGRSYAYTVEKRQVVIVRDVGEEKGVEVAGRSPSFSPDGKHLAVAIDDPNYLICPSAGPKKSGKRAKGCVAAARVSAYRTNDFQKEPPLALA
ncbi:MAG: hypothetical protein ACRD1T_20460, partial [Acidimicrobiia bacterium]